MRQNVSLAGTWQFQLDPDGSLSVGALSPDRQIPVPMPWQAAFPELRSYGGYAWYLRSFELDDSWLDGEVLLHFGAVDYWCQVFVNGALAGEHEGGYMPFTLPLADLVHRGENELAVRVYDAPQREVCIPRWPHFASATQSDGPPFDPEDIPHGKQEWYIDVGGIWQDVTLTATSRVYVESIRVTPDIHTGIARVEVDLASGGVAADATSLVVKISDEAGAVEKSMPLTSDEKKYRVDLRVEQPHLWSPADPHIYTVEAALGAGSHTDMDSLTSRFGFREIITKDGQLLLNGEPLFLRCALDQDLYPDTIYTVPSEEFLRDEFRKAKELGLNSLRCHIKPPDPRYLDLADEMGILIWTEIPSWRTFYVKGTRYPEQLNLPESIQRRVEITLGEMVKRDYNHPSIIIWTIVNEDWGTSLPLSAADRVWVKRMYERCKELDPTRLVVDNSACPHPWGPNIHVKSDIDDFHIYANMPDQAGRFRQMIEQFGHRPLWTYSSHADAERTGNEPLILSEFGNWGLPSLKLLRKPYGGAVPSCFAIHFAGSPDPPWFDTGPWWSAWEGEPGWPQGVEERFARLGLDDVWPDYEDFVEATQRHEFAALKYEIEVMRRLPNLKGYVITELSDIYWESNGLLDFYRNPKVFHDKFAEVNGPDLVAAAPASFSYWDDEIASFSLYASHYSPHSWEDTRLRWALQRDRGEAGIPYVQRGEVLSLGAHRWSLPMVANSQALSLDLQLVSGERGEVARNSAEVLVLPSSARSARYAGSVAVLMQRIDDSLTGADYADRPPEGLEWGREDQLPRDAVAGVPEGSPEETEPHLVYSSMARLGYKVASSLSNETDVAVSNFPDTQLLRWVREGGKLLFLSESASPFFWVQGRGSTYGGSWLTAYSWLRPGVHKRLQVANPLGFGFAKVMPQRTILGLPVEEPSVRPDFLAGQISGWVGHPAVHTVQFRYGKGKVIMTTFNLAMSFGRNPVATAMFHDLLEHLASETCNPVLRSNF